MPLGALGWGGHRGQGLLCLIAATPSRRTRVKHPGMADMGFWELYTMVQAWRGLGEPI